MERSLNLLSKDIHHIVPTFLGGSNEPWNKEVLTKEEHMQKHIDWALQLDTREAWCACLTFIGKVEMSEETNNLIRTRYGLSQRGEVRPKHSKRMSGKGNSMHGVKRPESYKKHMKEINTGSKNPMFGKTPWNKGKGKKND